MPARKPAALARRHSTKEEKSARESAEKAFATSTQLGKAAPSLLKSHKTATARWKKLISLYSEAEGTIVTAFDEDLLAKYCLLEEETIVLEKLRDVILKDWTALDKQLALIRPKGEDMNKYLKLLEQKNALLARYQGFDARLDGKRKLLHALSQSLYLTPRSRAGVAPTEKPAEDSDDPLEDMLK